MPIYEYKCQQCNHRFEQLIMSSSTESVVECPACHGSEVNRLFSTFGFSSGSTSRSASGGGASCHSCASKNCATCH